MGSLLEMQKICKYIYTNGFDEKRANILHNEFLGIWISNNEVYSGTGDDSTEIARANYTLIINTIRAKNRRQEEQSVIPIRLF